MLGSVVRYRHWSAVRLTLSWQYTNTISN